MNDLSQSNKNFIIKITKVEKKYFVSIKPYNQVKQIFCLEDATEAVSQIYRFLFGYLIGHMEKYPVDFRQLKKIIKNMKDFFDIDIKLQFN